MNVLNLLNLVINYNYLIVTLTHSIETMSMQKPMKVLGGPSKFFFFNTIQQPTVGRAHRICS